MALIFADDFQQLAINAPLRNAMNGSSAPAAAILCAGTIEAYGFERPVVRGSGGSSTDYYCNVSYGTNRLSLSVSNYYQQPAFNLGAVSLNRPLKYIGDTLYFSFVATLYARWKVAGTMLSFGNSLYTLSVLANYNYALNGVDTGVLAFYENTDVKLFHEIVLGPDYIEFWISNDLIMRQPRTEIPVDYFQFGFADVAATTNWHIDLHSLIICDNTGTEFNSRIGRKAVKTFTPNAIVKVESTLSVAGSNTALTILKPTASSKNSEGGPDTVGSLISPDGYVTNSFTTPIDKTPLAALVNMQMKRRTPSGDGMTAVPYIKIGDVVVEGKRLLPSSLWNVFPCAVPIAPGQRVDSVEFGYVHDYVDMNKIFIDDRTGVAIYGEDAGYALKGSGFLSQPITYKTSSVNNTAIQTYVMPYTNPKFANVDVKNESYSAYIIDYAKTSLKTVKQDVTNTTFNQEQTP